MFNKHLLFAIVLLATGSMMVAQNNTNSPYTRFGYGQLIDNYTAEQRAMGGISIAGRNSSSINTVNPASYTAVDSLTFMFDMGFTGLLSRFSDASGSTNQKFTSNLEYISLQFPLKNWMAVSAGVLPYSFSGYSFYRTDSVAMYHPTLTNQFATYTQSYNGSGGISQVFAGMSVSLFDRLALGVNAYYMFGEVTNRRSTIFQTSGFESSAQDNFIKVDSYRFRYGLQYFEKIGERHDLQLGLIFETKSQLGSESVQLNTGVPADTIRFSNEFDLPMVYGAGLQYTFNNKLTVGVDYLQQMWSDARYFSQTDSLLNRSRLSVGAEYLPDNRGRSYFERVKYRAGFTMSEPYYKIAGNAQPLNYGISFGVGLPLRASNSVINAAVEYGKAGERSLFREDYFKLTVSTTFSENWFFKRKL